MDEESLFAEALRQETPEQRAAFLDRACAGQPRLRESMESLLAAYYAEGELLEKPPAELAAVIKTASICEGPGSVIGPYQLLEQIGEGGMGVVYRAEQREPVQRQVALKIIKPGMDTQEVIARFETERQALALMDHTNVAKVLDAGSTETGRPYFVMELVHGVPITDFCDQNKLTLPDRLELFATVCQAVQHAHQKGIIHRDIKPSNILVSVHDGTPVVKIIDFGVAKAVNQRLTERTLFTKFAQIVGTPLYMSPEQAGTSDLDIDTRSDIYSLGALLYELLTGTTPFDRRRLGAAAFDEIRRIICEEDPPKPSTRITNLGETATTVGAHRQTDRQKLSASLRGDLDWIVMKALDKDRTRRYETASEFANDVLRFLNDEPVTACPPSLIYRFRKFTRRNKTSFVIGASTIATLILATVGLAALAGRLAVQRQIADAAAQRAESLLGRMQLERGLERLESDDFLGLLDVLQAYRLAKDSPGMQADIAFLWAGWHERYAGRLQGIVGHQGPVLDVAFSPDGTRLATGSDDGTVRLWNAHDRTPIGPPLFHASSVWTVVFSPDGKLLAVGTADGMARVWQVETHELLDRPLHCGSGALRCIRFSPNGKLLLTSAEDDSCARLWRVEGLHPLGQPVPRKLGRWDVAFSPDSACLALTRDNRETGLWDIETRTFRALGQHDGVVSSHCFSPDGQRLLTAGREIRVWDLEAWQQVGQTVRPDRYCVEAAFGPRGKRFATATADWTVQVWDPQTAEATCPPIANGNKPTCIVFGPGGEYLAIGTWDGIARLWRTDNGQPVTPPLRHLGPVRALAFHPNGTQLATASMDGTARLWNTAPIPEKWTITHKHDVLDVAFCPSGTMLATATERVHFWNLETGTPYGMPISHTAPVEGLAFGRRGDMLSTLSGGIIRCWVSPTFRLNGEPISHPAGFAKLMNGCHEDLLAAGTAFPDRKVYVIDPRVTDSQQLAIGGFSQNLHGLAISSVGSFLAVGTAEPTVGVWDLDNPSRPIWQQRRNGIVYSVAFSPDGEWLSVGSGDGLMTVHMVSDGRPVGSPLRHERDVWRVGFSPDGRFVASASLDGTVRLWPLMGMSPRYGLPLRHGGKVTALTISPDGRLVATAGEGRQAYVWRAPTECESIEEMELRTCVALGARLSPQGDVEACPWHEWERMRRELGSREESSRSPSNPVLYQRSGFLDPLANDTSLNQRFEAARQSHRDADYEAAERQYDKLIRRFETLKNQEPEAALYRFHLACALLGLGDVQLANGNTLQAEESLRAATKLFHPLVDAWPSDLLCRCRYGSSINRLARACAENGQLQEALELLGLARQVLRVCCTEAPEDHEYADTWRCCVRDEINLLKIHDEIGNREGRFKNLTDECQELLAVGPNNPYLRIALFLGSAEFATILAKGKKANEAFMQVMCAGRCLDDVPVANHLGTQAKTWPRSVGNVVGLLEFASESQERDSRFRQLIELCQNLLDRTPDSPYFRAAVLQGCAKFASILSREGRYEESLDQLDIIARCLADCDARQEFLDCGKLWSDCARHLADELSRAEGLRDRDTYFRRLLAQCSQLAAHENDGPYYDHGRFVVRIRFAGAVLSQGRTDETAELLRPAESFLTKLETEERIDQRTIGLAIAQGNELYGVGADQAAWRDYDSAEHTLRHSKKLFEATFGHVTASPEWRYAHARVLFLIARAVARSGRTEEGLSSYAEARSIIRDLSIVDDRPEYAESWLRWVSESSDVLRDASEFEDREVWIDQLIAESRDMLERTPDNSRALCAHVHVHLRAFEAQWQMRHFDKAISYLDSAQQICVRLRDERPQESGVAYRVESYLTSIAVFRGWVRKQKAERSSGDL